MQRITEDFSAALLIGGPLLAVVALIIFLAFVFLPASKRTRKCPDCKEKIKADARVCKHCGLRLVED